MTETKPIDFSDVEASIKDNNPKCALGLIEKMDERVIKLQGNIALSEYYYLYAKCLYMLSWFNDAHKKIKATLRFSEKTNDIELITKHKCLRGLILHKKGLLREAIRDFSEAIAIFKTLKDFRFLLAPLEGLTQIRYESGEIREAQELLLKAIRICDEHDFPRDRIRNKVNLSQVLFKGGRFREALQQLSLLEKEGLDDKIAADVSRLRGMIYAVQMRTEDAYQLLNSAKEYYESKGDRRMEVVCLEYLGLNEYLARNHDKAIENYKIILKGDDIIPSAKAQTYRFLTDAHIALGDFIEARKTASETKKAIEKSRERIELGALYRASAQILVHEGKQKKAIYYFEKSIDTLREIGALYELAMTFLACGQADIYSRSKQVENLRRAEGLFVEMDVYKRIEEIINELNKLNVISRDPIGANIELKEITIPDNDKTIREIEWQHVPSGKAISNNSISSYLGVNDSYRAPNKIGK